MPANARLTGCPTMASRRHDSYTARMNEPPDYQELARRYLDLWQEHLSQAAGDPAMTEFLNQTMAFWHSLLTPGAAPGKQTVWESDGDDRRPAGTGQREAPADTGGATTAPHPSGNADDALRDVLERLARLEQRVAELERGGGRDGTADAAGKPARKHGRGSKSKSARKSPGKKTGGARRKP